MAVPLFRVVIPAYNAEVYILECLDSDDSWLPKKLERVAAFISEHGDADLVCHDEWLVEEAHSAKMLRYGPYTAYEDLLFKRNCISTSATLVRLRNVLAVGGFWEDLRFNGAEDYDLWLRMAKAGCRFAYLHEVLGRYRVHEGGTTRKAEEYCAHTLNLLAVHFESFPETDPRYCTMMRRWRAGTLARCRPHVDEGGGSHARPAVPSPGHRRRPFVLEELGAGPSEHRPSVRVVWTS